MEKYSNVSLKTAVRHLWSRDWQHNRWPLVIWFPLFSITFPQLAYMERSISPPICADCCKVVWSCTFHCRPLNVTGGWHKVLKYCYMYYLKLLAPVSDLTCLLASQKRFCCELSQRIIIKWLHHGTTANKETLLANGRTLNDTLKSC